MPEENDKIEQKFIDRSAKEFTDAIATGALYRELRKKESAKDGDGEDNNENDKQ